jgi:uncharacterized protein YbaR (Trm112 family)
MKLLTHNFLKSHIKGVKNGYPLVLHVSAESHSKPQSRTNHTSIPAQRGGVGGGRVQPTVYRAHAGADRLGSATGHGQAGVCLWGTFCYEFRTTEPQTPLIRLPKVGAGEGLPDQPPENPAENEAFLRATHHALLEVNVVEGDLECPETGRKFPIKRGVPNMLLTEDEA